MTSTRIYLVRDPDTAVERLVRAYSQAAARGHVARDLECSAATQEQLVAMLTGPDRIEIEDAGRVPDPPDAMTSIDLAMPGEEAQS